MCRELLLVSLVCLFYGIDGFISSNKLNLYTTFNYNRKFSESKLFASQLWKGSVSSNTEITEALDEAIISCTDSIDDINDFNVAVFFVNSVYEYQSPKFEEIFTQIQKKIPSIKHIIGCTTGGVIGPSIENGTPKEVEARASVSLTLGRLNDNDVTVNTFRMEPEEIHEYINNENNNYYSDKKIIKDDTLYENGNKITMILSSEQSKSKISKFASLLKKREDAKVFGVVASSVTTLHMPKIFTLNDKGELTKYNNGIIGLTMSGNIDVKTIVARSCLPVGPVFKVQQANNNEILSLVEADIDDTITNISNNEDNEVEEGTQPLVQLDRVLSLIDADQSEKLKRELLVGVVSGPPQTEISTTTSTTSTDDTIDDNNNIKSILSNEGFCSQKPTTFDPFTGSITVPSLPMDEDKSSTFQFCVRDVGIARTDLTRAQGRLRNLLNEQNNVGTDVMATFLLGSMERGTRVFRFDSWESNQIYEEFTKIDNHVNNNSLPPISGMYSYGSFTAVEDDAAPLMEMDSVWAVITSATTSTTTSSNTASGVSSDDVASTDSSDDNNNASLSGTSDVMSTSELNNPSFDDSNDLVIVSKRDPEAAHAVRVATMDYVVPEKAPQPRNFLESLVWDREKDVDRLRERVPMARAMSLARAAVGKFPSRDLLGDIRDTQEKLNLLGGAKTPFIIVTLMKGSLHNGLAKHYMTLESQKEAEAQEERNKVDLGSMNLDLATAMTVANPNKVNEETLLELATDALNSGVLGLGVNVDSGVYRGSYDDMETIKLGCSVPVICDDLVIYGYQLLKAKSSGADAIKLHASILTTTEIEYNIKVAKAIGLTCIVVVASVPQALAVLKEVPSLQALCITGRNVRLWKLQPGKANKILTDTLVQEALIEFNNNLESSDLPPLVIFQDGFSTPSELSEAATNGVHAAILGEELVGTSLTDLKDTLTYWKVA